MKAISRNVDNIYYFDKKTNTKKSRHDTVRRDFRRILRANNPMKGLSRAARVLASNYDNMLKRSDSGIIFRKHEFISTITEVGIRQNNNIHQELADIFCIQYHQSVKIKNIVHRDGFTIQRTKNSEEILQNPGFFYSQKMEKNCVLDGKKFPPRWKKISSKIAHNHDVNCHSRDLDYKLEYKLEEEKRELKELSLFSSSKNISSIEVSEIRAREELEKSPCAGSPKEPVAQGEGFLSETKAKGGAELEPREAHKAEAEQKPEQVVTVCNQLNKRQYPRLLTAKEEKEWHLQRMQRNHENKGESSFSELMSKVLYHSQPEEQIIQESAQEPANVEQTLATGSFYEPAKVLRDLEQPLTIEQTQDMKQEQNYEYDEEESRKMLLSKAIFNAFGEFAANEIQDNCEFRFLAPDKLSIKIKDGFLIEEHQKAGIRGCIKSVYGENIKLVADVCKPLVIPTPSLASTVNHTESKNGTGAVVSAFPQDSMRSARWLKFKAHLAKCFNVRNDTKYSEYIIKHWYDKLRISSESNENMLVLLGSGCVIDRINQDYFVRTEEAVLASGVNIELRYECNQQKPIVISKATISR